MLLYLRSSTFICGSIFSLGVKRRTAAAGARGVGVLEDEAAAHDFVLEIDLNAVEIEVGLHIHENLHAVTVHFLVVVALGLFGEVEHVREPAAAAAFNTDAEPGLLSRELLIFDDLLDFLRGRLRG